MRSLALQLLLNEMRLVQTLFNFLEDDRGDTVDDHSADGITPGAQRVSIWTWLLVHMANY